MGLRWNNFLSGVLPVSHDSNHLLGSQSPDWCCQLSSFQGEILKLFYWMEVLWVCVCSVCVSLTLTTFKHCLLLSFYLGWACGELVCRREEGREELIVSEVKASFYFPLLSVRALGLQDRIPGHGLPGYGPWRWWMIPKPQPFCP